MKIIILLLMLVVTGNAQIKYYITYENLTGINIQYVTSKSGNVNTNVVVIPPGISQQYIVGTNDACYFHDATNNISTGLFTEGDVTKLNTVIKLFYGYIPDTTNLLLKDGFNQDTTNYDQFLNGFVAMFSMLMVGWTYKLIKKYMAVSSDL